MTSEQDTRPDNDEIRARGEKLREWLVAHAANSTCPYCCGNTWDISGTDESLGVLLDGADFAGLRPTGETMPLMSLMCMSCGSMRFVSTIWIRNTMKAEAGTHE